MRISLAVFAERFELFPNGNLNVFGIYESIAAEQFPLTLSALPLVFRIQLGYEDWSEEPHKLRLELVNQDSKSAGWMEVDVKVAKIAPGKRHVESKVATLNGVVFPKPDEYTLIMKWNGQEVQRVALSVTRAEPQAPPLP